MRWPPARKPTGSIQPFYFIALGLTLAVSPLTAQALGAAAASKRTVMRQGLWLAVVYVITLIPLWFGRDLLLALGQDAELAENAGHSCACSHRG